MIQRRLYIYIVAAASLAMLLIGLVNLGSTAINQILNTTSPYTSARDAYAGFGAVTLVGLPFPDGRGRPSHRGRDRGFGHTPSLVRLPPDVPRPGVPVVRRSQPAPADLGPARRA